MNSVEFSTEMVGQIMDLGMTVMTSGYAVIRTCCNDLIEFELAVGTPCLRISGLQETAAAATTIIVGFIRGHLDEILVADNRFNNKPQIIRHCIAIPFSNDLAGVLHSEFDSQILVPIGIHLQSSFTYPFGIVLINGCNFELMVDFEFFQSGPD